MAAILLAQTGVAVALNDFNDNYLCLMYVLKIFVDAGCYWFMPIFQAGFAKKLFTVRAIYDVLQLGAGYCLLRFLNIHLECYLILCGVVALEITCSAICVFALNPRGASYKFQKNDIEQFSMVRTNEEVAAGDNHEENGDVVSVSAMKRKPAAMSSMISGSTAASFMSR